MKIEFGVLTNLHHHRFFQKSKIGHEPGTNPTNQHRGLGIRSSIQKTRIFYGQNLKTNDFFLIGLDDRLARFPDF